VRVVEVGVGVEDGIASLETKDDWEPVGGGAIGQFLE
jgi:hypothetical protein